MHTSRARYVCVYYIYILYYICTYREICVCVRGCVYTYIQSTSYIDQDVYARICILTYPHMYIHIYIYTHVHVVKGT